MKTTISVWTRTTICSLALLTAMPAVAQSKGAAASPAHKVGLIDLTNIFKNYEKFKDLREEVQADIKVNEEKAKAKVEKLQAVQKEIREFKEGSDEFRAREKQIAMAQADFEAFRRDVQREMLKKETQIYHQVYMEVSDAVKSYANHYGYTLVIRFSGEELDTENPQNLLNGMNRQVVYHREEDDITGEILKYLQTKYSKSKSASAPAREAKSPSPIKR